MTSSSKPPHAHSIEEAIHSTVEPKSLAGVGGPQSAGASVTGAVIAGFEEGIIQRIGNYRWMICALLFFATTINYIDRQVLGILATDKGFQQTIGWNEAQYGYVNTVFQAAYALGLLAVGNLMDRFGTRKGFSFAVSFWSVAAMCHALAHSAIGFGAARFALGLGEAGNFPAAIKTVAEWFPKKERALATGIFNSGSNVGAIVAPLAVPFIAVNYGWQLAFIITGTLGFIWLAFWENTLGATVSTSPNVGFRYRQVHDGSNLVGLSFLVAEIPQYKLQPEHHANRLAAGGDLCLCGRRLDWRRVAIVDSD